MRDRDPESAARSADLTMPAGRDDLDHVPAGTSPMSVKPSGELRPDGAGKQSDKEVFVAKVAPDGTVTMTDRPDFQIHWDPTTPHDIGKGIADWYASDKGPDGKRGKRTLENEVFVDPDPGIDGHGIAVVVTLFRGRLSFDDWMMRKHVGDPYASKKKKFLDATRDERAEMATQNRRVQLNQVVIIMRKNLERAWAAGRDVTERKRMLFELWDEVVDGNDGDELLAEAAKTARGQVYAFIRAHLTGADAYTEDELASFNRQKRSGETFAPY